MSSSTVEAVARASAESVSPRWTYRKGQYVFRAQSVAVGGSDIVAAAVVVSVEVIVQVGEAVSVEVEAGVRGCGSVAIGANKVIVW
jgi:hypothetical protein